MELTDKIILDINRAYEKVMPIEKINIFTYCNFLKDSGFNKWDSKYIKMVTKYFKDKKYFNNVNLLFYVNDYDDEDGTLFYGLNSSNEDLYDFIKDFKRLKTQFIDDDNDDYRNEDLEMVAEFLDNSELSCDYMFLVKNTFISNILINKFKKELNKFILEIDYQDIDGFNFIEHLDLNPNIYEEEDEDMINIIQESLTEEINNELINTLRNIFRN